MSQVRVKCSGPTELKAILQAFAAGYPDAVAEALYRTARKTMAKSAYLVPVDKGRLRGSRFVNEPVIAPGKITVSMGYATDYAAAVHERLDLYHKPPTMAKYLEAPLLQDLPTYPQEIADASLRLIMEVSTA